MSVQSEIPYSLSQEDRQTLLQLAQRSIEHGLNFRRALEVSAREYSEPLQQERALFVTLHLGKQLRGCIGTTEATNPLVCNVARYAYFAAFNDSRFSAMTWEEMPELEIQISVLTPPVPMQFTTESDLVAQFRPDEDGLILEAEGHRGTFLPTVWEMLPDRWEFWRQLKRKAGLSQEYWSANLKVSRYNSYCFSNEGEP